MTSPATTSASALPAPGVWRGLLLVCLAGVIWGTIGPVAHLVHEGSVLSPLTITAYRAAIAVAVLLGFGLVTGRLRAGWPRARQQWRRVVVVGVLTAGFQLLFFISVVAIGVSVATVVCLGFAPVLLLVLDSARQHRLPAPPRVATVAVAVAGLTLVCVAGGAREHAENPTLGAVTALAAGTAYALSTEVAAPLSQRLDTLTVTTATMSVAGMVLVPAGLLVALLNDEPLTSPDPVPWLLIAYLGIVTMAIAYALLFTGLRSTPSGAAVVATLIEPVTAVLIAVLFLGEHLTLAGVVGVFLIIVAIAGAGHTQGRPQPQ